MHVSSINIANGRPKFSAVAFAKASIPDGFNSTEQRYYHFDPAVLSCLHIFTDKTILPVGLRFCAGVYRSSSLTSQLNTEPRSWGFSQLNSVIGSQGMSLSMIIGSININTFIEDSLGIKSCFNNCL